MKGSHPVLIIFFIVLMDASPLFATITLLTPVSGKVTSLRQIILVVKGPADGIRILNGNTKTSYPLLNRVLLKGGKEAIYHFRILLEKRKNTFLFMPGKEGINIFWDPSISMARPRRFPRVYLFHERGGERVCYSCHKKLAKLPTGNKACLPCHKDKVNPAKGRWIHSPLVLRSCFVCHVKGFPDKGIRFAPIDGGSAKLCFRCHISNRRWEKMKHIHALVGSGNCYFCHNPHSSTRKYYLRYGRKQQICLICHREKAKQFSAKGFHAHAILTASGCIICHSPHASNYPYQLVEATVPLCIGCHPRFKGMRRGHPITNHPLQGPKNPLHPQKRFSCVSCHNPHGSRFSFMLIAPQGSQLCSRCHPY